MRNDDTQYFRRATIPIFLHLFFISYTSDFFFHTSDDQEKAGISRERNLGTFQEIRGSRGCIPRRVNIMGSAGKSKSKIERHSNSIYKLVPTYMYQFITM